MSRRIYRMFRASEGEQRGTLTWCDDAGSSVLIWDPDSGRREEFGWQTTLHNDELASIILDGRVWDVYKELPVTAPVVSTASVSLNVTPRVGKKES